MHAPTRAHQASPLTGSRRLSAPAMTRVAAVGTLAVWLGFTAPWALAKLPAPSPEAAAKAEEAKAKTAWSDKVAAFQLCKSQDRTAAAYQKAAAAAGRASSAPVATAPCADPGPFVPPAAASAAPAVAAAVAAPPKAPEATVAAPAPKK